MRAVVTVRTDKKRTSTDKISGICPLDADGIVYCTDIEGIVHSYIETGNSFQEIEKKAKDKFGDKILRIEGLNLKFLSS